MARRFRIRKLRKVKDYRDHNNRKFKTKSGQVWKDGAYFRRGLYKTKLNRTRKSGFVRYMPRSRNNK